MNSTKVLEASALLILLLSFFGEWIPLIYLRRMSQNNGFPQKNLPKNKLCLESGCLSTAYGFLSSINTSVDPCKNFYEFACGRWAEKKFQETTFSIKDNFDKALSAFTKNILKEILIPPQKPKDSKYIKQAKQYYRSCFNNDATKIKNLESLKKILLEFGGWPLLNPSKWRPDEFDWLKTIADANRRGFGNIMFEVEVARNLEGTLAILSFDQPKFTLARDELVNSNFLSSKNYSAYIKYIVEISRELGSTQNTDELISEAKEIISFEILLAKISSDSQARQNVHMKINLMTLQMFQWQMDLEDVIWGITIPWKAFLDRIFSTSGIVTVENNDLINIREIEYFRKLSPVLKAVLRKPNVLANYVMWRIVDVIGTDITPTITAIKTRFEDITNGKKVEKLPCFLKVLDHFRVAITTEYFKMYPQVIQDIQKITKISDFIRHEIISLVGEKKWLRHDTKQKTIDNLEAIDFMVGYPQWITDNETMLDNHYGKLEMGDNHFENELMFLLHQKNKSLAGLRNTGSNTDNKWLRNPLVINALYSSITNNIEIPLGYHNSPFYKNWYPMHQAFGRIGFLIAHEFTHGIKANYDPVLQEEWDKDSIMQYNERTTCMEKQYSRHFSESGARISERRLETIKGNTAENVADNTGLRASYKAYRKFVEENGEEQRLPGMEAAYSTDQLFFLGYANVFCGSATNKESIDSIINHEHSPYQFRVNVPLMNFDKFAEAFKCSVDSKGMNPPAEEKCLVW